MLSRESSAISSRLLGTFEGSLFFWLRKAPNLISAAGQPATLRRQKLRDFAPE